MDLGKAFVLRKAVRAAPPGLLCLGPLKVTCLRQGTWPSLPYCGFDLSLTFLLMLSMCLFASGLLGNPRSFSSGVPVCHALCLVLTRRWWIRIKHTYHVSGILLDLLCTCFSLVTVQWNRVSCSPLHMRNSRPRGVLHFTQSHTAHTSRTEKLTWVVPNPMLISTLPFSPERWGMLLCFCGCVWILSPQIKAHAFEPQHLKRRWKIM